ncbi:hypothetical protein [Thomasclavelia sp.]
MKKFKSLFKCKLDERELKIRGNIYFKSFSILSFIIIALFFGKEIFDFDPLISDWEYLIALFIGLTYCIVSMIYYEIYPLTKPRYRILFILSGIYGLGFFGFYAILVFQGSPLIINNQLSVVGCELIFTSFYIIIFIAYVTKVIYNHYHQDDDN